MTRINVVPPTWLTDQHLLAELRELPRVLGKANGARPDAPSDYKLGKGHVLFFYGRRRWLARRQRWLVAEWTARGGSWRYPPPPDEGPPLWKPSREDLRVNLERLDERTLFQVREPRLRGEVVLRDHYERYLWALDHHPSGTPRWE